MTVEFGEHPVAQNFEMEARAVLALWLDEDTNPDEWELVDWLLEWMVAYVDSRCPLEADSPLADLATLQARHTGDDLLDFARYLTTVWNLRRYPKEEWDAVVAAMADEARLHDEERYAELRAQLDASREARESRLSRERMEREGIPVAWEVTPEGGVQRVVVAQGLEIRTRVIPDA